MDTKCIPRMKMALSLHIHLDKESMLNKQLQSKEPRQHAMPSGLHEKSGCSTSDDEYGYNEVSYSFNTLIFIEHHDIMIS